MGGEKGGRERRREGKRRREESGVLLEHFMTSHRFTARKKSTQPKRAKRVGEDLKNISRKEIRMLLNVCYYS